MGISKALPIQISSRTEMLLQQIVRGTTNPYRLVRRAKLILGAVHGESNSSMSRRLELDREQVALWRKRWREQSEKLAAAEQQQVTDKKLMVLIKEILSDRPRPGTTKSFTVEQVVQIVAIACESPEKSDRPISHWTPKELADEAMKRGIVEEISPRSAIPSAHIS
ncbi:MAG: helix-turn-helix domain-containing protein [Crocosphaera sp.]|uniref:helix-turn-helix domain-containing protein n=1 Tax=Crocosphaera sp. TaxID=2729996 RepID=UPI00258DB87D|nr:helix-turn-helix domain-containing protein [Crocosphaera sp.]MCH2246734.1 helix-turn-helix domain-containing protein [Crocosphaera sp.]